jgi:asparagine synthase (glutamine-hydrolysing)
MSGIVGIYYFDERPVALNDVGRMVDQLAHRGPDGSDLWVEGAVGLGHRMLWTTPESVTEQLPAKSPSGHLVITADARIDNRDDLIRILALPMSSHDPVTDSQLILAAYEKWGEHCLKHLIGDYAFAIWNRRDQVLFCGRDTMGVKPFYYYHSEQFFAFASEIKALFCLTEVPRKLNEVRVADYIVRCFDDQSATFYQDIRRLPSATHLYVSRDRFTFESYWQLDASRKITFKTDAEYAEAFREVFTEAVRCRLRRVYEVGSTLSGGLDSSSIACTSRDLLKQAGQDSLPTFSAIFPSLPESVLSKIDERQYIEAVVAMGGVKPHYLRADLLNSLTDMEQVLWHVDEPFPPPNMYIHWAMFKMAQQQNVRVMLEGSDGDSTVSHGWELLPELARTGRWGALCTEATALSQKYECSPWNFIWDNGFKPLLDGPLDSLKSVLRGHRPMYAVNYRFIDPEFANAVGIAERVGQFQATDVNAAWLSARQVHCQGIAMPMFQYVLELVDKMAAAFALEARYPFFDRRLMEFCVALPPEQKLHQGWGRYVMRRAMEGILPPAVQWRLRKGNLSANYRYKMLEYDQATMEQAIFHPPSPLEKYMNIAALQANYQDYANNPMKGDAMAVCGAVTLGLWFNQFQAQSRQPVSMVENL